ncbi:hypothetical protein DM860_007294 [Cuscuta australis]|uniref:Replication factor A C-terminal domain-containing protein n=1 Tax=Cuscuta australis TaxID=267555 RepID=A0A328E3C4_9ASTE|nr:hypothetical protein DM860_007294 [Cuscuta australis]
MTARFESAIHHDSASILQRKFKIMKELLIPLQDKQKSSKMIHIFKKNGKSKGVAQCYDVLDPRERKSCLSQCLPEFQVDGCRPPPHDNAFFPVHRPTTDDYSHISSGITFGSSISYIGIAQLPSAKARSLIYCLGSFFTSSNYASTSLVILVILIEKLNERQSARGVTYRAMIMEDSKGHKVKVMTYGQDITILDKRLEVNNTYKIFNAKVSQDIQGFGVPDESYRNISTLNRRTMIHDVSSEEKILIQPSAEPEMDPFSMFYKAMLTNKKINVFAIVIAKLQRKFVFTKKGQKMASDFIIIDHESPGMHNSAGTAIRLLSHNNCKEDSSNIFQRKSSNTSAIEHAIEMKKWLDPLSLFAKPEDNQTTPISEVASTENEEDVHWGEGQLQVLEAGDITLYIGCSSCNRKVDYIEGINFKCMLCGDLEAKTIKRFRIMAEIKDEVSALQVTLFIDTLEKIVRALEFNTPMELIKCVDLNNILESKKVTAAVKLPPRTEPTSASKTFSVQCLYDLRDEKTTSPTLKRKLKVEEPSPKKSC